MGRAGATWPGHIALKIKPDFLREMENKLPKGSIVLSGTNGKTTTALMIASILRESGLKVLHNASGANMLNGLASSLIADTNLSGKLKSDIAVFEIDEANLPHALKSFKPETILLLNLSRDQLDRYGEVEIMLEKWKEALAKLPDDVGLILNGEDKRLVGLGQRLGVTVKYFSLNVVPTTNHKLEPWPSPLPGKFNKLNAFAAVKVAKTLKISDEIIKNALKNFKPAFGRGEEFKIKGRKIKMLLAKNPASFNANLELISTELQTTNSILFILNDNIPDGRDVSWIYDIDPEPLKQVCNNKKIFVSGTRCYDMALRLKYADVEIQEKNISGNLEKIIQLAIEQTPEDGMCLMLPTYSAMLEGRKVLCGKRIL